MTSHNHELETSLAATLVDVQKSLRQIHREQRMLQQDLKLVHSAVLQLSHEVTFFAKRCEDRRQALQDVIEDVEDQIASGNGAQATLQPIIDALMAIECAGPLPQVAATLHATDPKEA